MNFYTEEGNNSFPFVIFDRFVPHFISYCFLLFLVVILIILEAKTANEKTEFVVSIQVYSILLIYLTSEVHYLLMESIGLSVMPSAMSEYQIVGF